MSFRLGSTGVFIRLSTRAMPIAARACAAFRPVVKNGSKKKYGVHAITLFLAYDSWPP